MPRFVAVSPFSTRLQRLFRTLRLVTLRAQRLLSLATTPRSIRGAGTRNTVLLTHCVKVAPFLLGWAGLLVTLISLLPVLKLGRWLHSTPPTVGNICRRTTRKTLWELPLPKWSYCTDRFVVSVGKTRLTPLFVTPLKLLAVSLPLLSDWTNTRQASRLTMASGPATLFV